MIDWTSRLPLLVQLAVLPYGKAWESGGFRCVSEKTGLTCTNRDGHGGALLRAKQTLK